MVAPRVVPDPADRQSEAVAWSVGCGGRLGATGPEGAGRAADGSVVRLRRPQTHRPISPLSALACRGARPIACSSLKARAAAPGWADRPARRRAGATNDPGWTCVGHRRCGRRQRLAGRRRTPPPRARRRRRHPDTGSCGLESAARSGAFPTGRRRRPEGRFTLQPSSIIICSGSAPGGPAATLVLDQIMLRARPCGNRAARPELGCSSSILLS